MSNSEATWWDVKIDAPIVRVFWSAPVSIFRYSAHDMLCAALSRPLNIWAFLLPIICKRCVVLGNVSLLIRRPEDRKLRLYYA